MGWWWGGVECRVAGRRGGLGWGEGATRFLPRHLTALPQDGAGPALPALLTILHAHTRAGARARAAAPRGAPPRGGPPPVPPGYARPCPTQTKTSRACAHRGSARSSAGIAEKRPARHSASNANGGSGPAGGGSNTRDWRGLMVGGGGGGRVVAGGQWQALGSQVRVVEMAGGGPAGRRRPRSWTRGWTRSSAAATRRPLGDGELAGSSIWAAATRAAGRPTGRASARTGHRAWSRRGAPSAGPRAGRGKTHNKFAHLGGGAIACRSPRQQSGSAGSRTESGVVGGDLASLASCIVFPGLLPARRCRPHGWRIRVDCVGSGEVVHG
jgi:hypothetical protein